MRQIRYVSLMKSQSSREPSHFFRSPKAPAIEDLTRPSDFTTPLRLELIFLGASSFANCVNSWVGLSSFSEIESCAFESPRDRPWCFEAWGTTCRHLPWRLTRLGPQMVHIERGGEESNLAVFAFLCDRRRRGNHP